MRKKIMTKFPDLDALVEAKAQASHQANLTCGGVFGEDGQRTSNLGVEREYARTLPVFVSAHYAKAHGLPESLAAWYIRGFGYAPAYDGRP